MYLNEVQVFHPHLIQSQIRHPLINIHLYSKANIIHSIQLNIPRKISHDKLWQGQHAASLLSYLGNLGSANDLTHQIGTTLAIERLYGIEYQIPKYINAFRVCILEWDRIFSHIEWLINFLEGCGLNFIANRWYKIKILLVNFIQQLSDRPYSKLDQIIKIGEFGFNISKENTHNLFDTIKDIRSKILLLIKPLSTHLTLKKLLGGVGLLSKKQAENSTAVGPIARASGILRDLRFGNPYLDYYDLSFKPIISRSNDLWGLFKVRIGEIKESLRIIEIILDQEHNFTETFDIESIDINQEGHMSVRVETPRGPAIYSIDTDPKMIIKGVSILSPTITNIPSLEIRLQSAPMIHSSRIILAYDQCFKTLHI